MKKSLIIFSVTLILFNGLLFGQSPNGELQKNIKKKKINYKIETNIYIDVVENIDKNHEELAHPVLLSDEALGRIMYAFKVDGPGLNPHKLFSIEEIRELIENGRLSEAFKKATKYEKVKLSRVVEAIDEHGKVVESREEIFFMFFKSNDELYVTYVTRGYRISRFMVNGLDMTDGIRWDGSPFTSTISINKKLWTTDLKKTIFPITDDLSKILSIGKEKKTVENKEKKEIQEFSLEDMQKELENLKKMLDSKLITNDEYKKLKAKVLAKAGL